MTKKPLPPIEDNPSFKELLELLKKQPEDRLNALKEMLEKETKEDDYR
jgi:hypothetical protein